MKHFNFAASVFVCSLLVSSTTFAHVHKQHACMKDMLMKDVCAGPYNWTGYYIGLNAGAVKYTMNITDVQATTFNATIQQTSNPAFIGGFQAGYRRQLDFAAASGVYGIEFTAEYAHTTNNQRYGSPFALYQLNSTNELRNVYMLQLIGGIAADRTLLFLAAGLSYSNIAGSVVNNSGIPFFNSFNDGKDAIGSAIGAGIEYAFTNNISARAKIDVVTPNNYSTNDNVGNQYKITNSIVLGTVGVNYKF